MNKILFFLILNFSIIIYSNERGKIIFPFQSTVLLPNYTYEISWEGIEDFGEKIKIELFQEGNSFLIIIPETENDGKFSWIVPKNLHSGIPNPYNYSIRIYDLLNPSNFIESDLFIISPNDFIYPYVIIPASAHSSGAYNSNWKTDLYFFNSFDLEETVDIYLFFFKEGRAENEAPIGYFFKIKTNEVKVIEDVVKNCFRTNGAGSIIIEQWYMHQIYWVIPVSAFLYNDMGELGKYGTRIPAMGDSADAYYFTNKPLLNLRENENFRTNIGIASKADFPINVQILLYDDNANLIGEKTILIPPYGFYQEYQIYKQFTSEPINKGFATVWVRDDYQRHFIYPFASVIDNRFGDVYFIPQF